MVDDARRAKDTGLGEFDIIARYFAPLATDKAALGLRDDAAVLRVAEGYELVVSCDTLIEGVHFLPGDPPDSIGYKALAVNLSDLTAKGARGYAYLLSLAVPRDTAPAWFKGFATGLRALQEESGICLIGGDTTASPGPPTITITALGLVTHGHAVLRHGAKANNRLYVSGTIGDAYLGLRLLKDKALAKAWDLSDKDVNFLIGRYRRPEPRTDLVIPLRNFAQGAIDVSDGLVLDTEKLAKVSHAGAVIETSRVPFSPAARKALDREPALLEALIAGGDDYEVVAAVAETSAAAFETEAAAKGVTLTMFGRIDGGGDEARVIGPDGAPLKLARKGFSHF
ncbi:MAG: thiamine-phosphate kinase [Methyloceanibacter sp.]